MYLLFVLLSAACVFGAGYGIGILGRKKDRRASKALMEINRWAIRNQDVYPEAATTIQDVVGTYYDKEI